MDRLTRSPWRAAPAMLAGILAGSVLISPAVAHVTDSLAHLRGHLDGRYVNETTKVTRSASCAGLSFFPNTNDESYGYQSSVRTSTGEETFACDPGLPNRAVVTRVQFSLADNDPAQEVRECALRRTPLTGTTPTAQYMAGPLPGTGMPGTQAGRVLRSTTAISFAKIDNERFAYWLSCEISGPMSNFGYLIGIAGASVRYQIPARNG